MHVEQIAPGLWSWTARHPDWRSGYTWDAEVRCFYVEADEATLVVDPLVPDDAESRFWDALDRDVERRNLPVAVLLTQAAHARSAGEVAKRYRAQVWGHEYARRKVGSAAYHAIAPGNSTAGDAVALEFDQEPGGSGTPLYFPSHRALAVGDVFLTVDRELRIWWAHGASGVEWYRDRLLPSLRTWLDLPIEHVLVADGEPLPGGSELLRAALERSPYDVD